MKKIILNLVILIITFTTLDLVADGGGEIRKNCYGFLRYRYKAWASISSKVSNRSRKVNNSSCSGFTVTASDVNCVSCPNNVRTSWGESKTTISNNGVKNSFVGNNSHFNYGKFENDNTLKSYNNYNLLDNITTTADVDANMFWENENSVTNNNVNFNSFNASIKLGINDLTSRYTYEIIIWKANNDFDSTITQEKVLWNTSFIYTNNQLITYGLLSSAALSYNVTDSTRTMFLNMNTLNSIIINETGSIRITTRLHKDDTYNIQERTIKNENSEKITDQIDFNSIHSNINESKNLYLNLETLNKSTFDFSNLKISLLDINGKIIKNVNLTNNYVFENNNLIINESLSDVNLPTNIYLIKIEYASKTIYNRLFYSSN